MPLDAIYDAAPPPGGETLLVMLPGTGTRPHEMIDRGFVRAVRERRLRVDAVVVDAHPGLYLDRSLDARLAQDIVAPARGARRVWLLGISLGGMGALLYARAHPADIEGVILLAPFLGTRGAIAKITRAGGLDHWCPGAIAAGDDEAALLAWLKTCRADPAQTPAIYLGYGTRDRYAGASALLVGRLPAERVVTIDGGHDWATWLELWERTLDHGLFSTPDVPPARPGHDDPCDR